MQAAENINQQAAEPIDLAAQKQQLEIDKLNEEIKELQKKWYRKPAYLAALLPTFIGTVSLIVLFFNGNFSSKAESLKLESDKLSYRIQKFQDSSRIYEAQKDSLRLVAKFYQDSVNKVVQLAVKNQKETDSVKDQLESLLKNFKTATNQQQKDQVTASVQELVDKLQKQKEVLIKMLNGVTNDLQVLKIERNALASKEEDLRQVIEKLFSENDSLRRAFNK